VFLKIRSTNLSSQQATNNYVNYFPNVTELTIKHYFKRSTHLIRKILNSIVPMKQLTKLNFYCFICLRKYEIISKISGNQCTYTMNTIFRNKLFDTTASVMRTMKVKHIDVIAKRASQNSSNRLLIV
jgi:hypothetical protein